MATDTGPEDSLEYVGAIPGPQTAEHYQSTHDWRTGTIWDVPAAERAFIQRAIDRSKALAEERKKAKETRAWPDP